MQTYKILVHYGVFFILMAFLDQEERLLIHCTLLKNRYLFLNESENTSSMLPALHCYKKVCLHNYICSQHDILPMSLAVSVSCSSEDCMFPLNVQ